MQATRFLFCAIMMLTLLWATAATADVMWWNKSYGDDQNEYGASVCADLSGNIVMTGAFADTINFGGGDLVSAGSWDVFLAKFDPNGNHLWSYRYGAQDADEPVAVATDPNGNVFVLGTFQRTVDFGGGPLTCTGGVLPDVFLVKYSPDGAHIWSKRFGGSGFERAGGLAVDDIGRSVITGGFTGTTDFGGGSVSAVGIEDVFVAKYSPAGNYVWSLQFGNSSSQAGLGVAVDASYNVIVTGEFYGSVDFGGGILTSSGNTDIFVAKYTISGNHVWSKRYGFNSVSLNNDPQSGKAIAVDASDNIIVTGDFIGSVNFGGGAMAAVGVDNDVFVAQLDPNGVHQWSTSFGGPAGDHVYSLAVDASNDVTLTGSFQETVNFGGGPIASNNNSEDIFLVKYDVNGNHIWSGGFGDVYDVDHGRGVAFDPAGDLLVTGRFRGTLDLGHWPNLTSASTGNTDVLLAKFTSDPTAVRPGGYASGLSVAYPNPFNPATRVDYTVTRRARVRLAVYDVSGRRVAVLVDRVRTPGTYTAEWEAAGAASGVYFIRLESDAHRITRKAVLLK